MSEGGNGASFITIPSDATREDVIEKFVTLIANAGLGIGIQALDLKSGGTIIIIQDELEGYEDRDPISLVPSPLLTSGD